MVLQSRFALIGSNDGPYEACISPWSLELSGEVRSVKWPPQWRYRPLKIRIVQQNQAHVQHSGVGVESVFTQAEDAEVIEFSRQNESVCAICWDRPFPAAAAQSNIILQERPAFF